MVNVVKRFNIDEVVKLKCFLGYSCENRCIFITAQGIESISRVRIVVI